MEVQSQVQVMGIDAGGTMTDTFFVREDGRVVGKAQSNPQDESLAIFNSSQTRSRTGSAASTRSTPSC